MKFPTPSFIFLLSVSTLGFGQVKEASTTESLTEELSPYQRVSMYLGHSLFKAQPISRQSEILWGIKAVRPMLQIAEGIRSDFDLERVEEKMKSILKEKGVQIDEENGHLLYFRIRGVWDKEKANLLYTYDLDLVDKIYVSRDGQIKSNFRSVWNISNMGFAGVDVYQNAMLINVESAVERFAISYYEQLDYDIISDTPRMAKQTYRKIRDGDEDIIKLLGDQQLGE
jgi:hypothetical protein